MVKTALEWPDFVVIGIHFAITVGVGLWAARRSSKSTSKGYFLAGRSMSWYLVGASLYVSNIGSSSFMGIGGASTANGIAVVCFEFTGLFIIQLLGFVFMPVYLSSGVYTTPEYVRKRFGGRRCNIYLAVQNLILFILTKLSTEIYAGALIIQYTLGWDKYLSVLGLLAFTTLYTVVGGLASVIYTDALQTVVILIGGTILSVMSMIRVGGYDAIMNNYLGSVSSGRAVLSNSTCGEAPDNFAHIFRPASDPNYPWPGVVFGANILSYWYFCTDQVLVQRLLSAKNSVHAKAGSIMAGYMKILPLFLMAWPGMIARILIPDLVACGNAEECKAACDIEQGCSNFAYIGMVHEVMPVGLKGLMLAAMLAALMSSLTSIFNSGSTVFTLDLWKTFRKNATEMELMVVGRLFVLVFVGVAIAWIPMIDNSPGGQIFNYLQSVTSYLAPPVGAVYLLGMMTTRANEKGAFAGLLVGFVVGVARMIADFVLPAPTCGVEDTRPWVVSGVHFLHYAIFLFVLSLIVIWIVSILTAPPSRQELYRTTWWTKDQYIEELEPKSTAKEVQEINENRNKDDQQNDEAIAKKLNAPRTKAKFSVKAFLLNWFCGISNKDEDQIDMDAERRHELLANVESKTQKAIVEWNLVLVICAGVFIWGFFA